MYGIRSVAARASELRGMRIVEQPSAKKAKIVADDDLIIRLNKEMIFADNDDACRTAEDLADAGIAVAALIDARKAATMFEKVFERAVAIRPLHG